MKRSISILCLAALPLCAGTTKAKGHKAPAVKTLASDPRTEPRVIEYHPGRAEPVYVQHGWETVIVLPKDKTYLDVLCGDQVARTKGGDAQQEAHWVINSFKGSNFVSVRPAANTLKATDLTITTDSGMPLTFILTDVTTTPNAHADTTVVIREGGDPFGADGKPKFATVDEVASMKDALDALGKRIDSQDSRIEKGLQENKAAAVFEDAATVRHHYKYNHKKAAGEPFCVGDIWNDGKHTFIKVSTSEAPAFYEFKDGSLNWTNWDLRNGVYFVPHVVDKGELRIGKKKITFEREKS